MGKLKKLMLAIFLLFSATFSLIYFGTRINITSEIEPGEIIDQLDGIFVYYNGGVNQSQGRSLDSEGYNIGIKYQCVEFVKRYYLEHFKHKMPESRGHAKTFYDPTISDGQLNPERGLVQFQNGSTTPPQHGDIVVFGPTLINPYGHVAIVAEVNDYSVIIVQQNAGPFASSRDAIPIKHQDNSYHLSNLRVKGWLSMPDEKDVSRAVTIDNSKL